MRYRTVVVKATRQFLDYLKTENGSIEDGFNNDPEVNLQDKAKALGMRPDELAIVDWGENDVDPRAGSLLIVPRPAPRPHPFTDKTLDEKIDILANHVGL
jgi:hypothetical protein